MGDLLDRVVVEEGPPLCITDPDGRVLFASRSFREMAGPSNGDAGEIGPDTAVCAAMRLDLLEVKRTGEPIFGTRTFIVDGETRSFSYRFFPVREGEKLIALAATFADVSEQAKAVRQTRRTQHRFEDFLRSTSDWVWETDAQGRITFVSERIMAVLGEATVDIVGRHLQDIGHFVIDEGAGPGLPHAMRSRNAFRDQIFEMVDQAGCHRTCQLSGVPVFDRSSGEFSGFRGAATDVTLLHAAEHQERVSRRDLETTLEELTNANARLDVALAHANAASKAQTEFLANMSHELRTPLNAVIGFSDVMVQKLLGPIDQRYAAYSKHILDAGRHLLSLVDDVLDMARIDHGKLSLTTEPTPLAELVREAMSLVVLRAREKKIDTEDAQVAGHWTVVVDPMRARQVFINLISNAVKFTSESGAIGIEATAPAEGMVAVTVWDTGPGIAADIHDKIFDRFEQGRDDHLTRAHDGSGLGLTIARHLARLMGGDITIDSAPGQGSRFTVRLPGYSGTDRADIP
jgi:PAS domain S-box-containing protein